LSGSGRGSPPPAPPPEARREAILRERARELAQERETRGVETVPLLPFEVGGERYAVEVTGVHQVLDARSVDPLLGAPRGVIGATVSRGRPVPVFDLRSLLGLDGGGLTDLTRVVVVDDDGDLFGFAVERVSARLDVPATDLRPADSGPFRWMAPDRLPVLDPSRLGLAVAEGG
jgi:purine-binding chemotaxis protein CheW